MIPLAEYPFRRRCDVGTAMARALKRHLEAVVATVPQTTAAAPSKLQKVHETWASFQEQARGALPNAALLPDRGTYDASSLSPRALEETWYPAGGAGWVLWAVAEYVRPFVLLVRARNDAEGAALAAAVEDSFVEAGGPSSSPGRYGVVLDLGDDYYRRKARFTLQAQQLVYSEEEVAANRYLAYFEITGEAVQVVPRVARPMSPQTPVEVDGASDAR